MSRIVQMLWGERRGRATFGAVQRLPMEVFGRRHDESMGALKRPATEKRQGTKSRSEVHRWCGGLYGELTAAPELEAV